jgi:hypothetical protein
MIAICPSCHDDVHHNVLVIDDDTVYRWKNIQRDLTNRDHMYVEPGESSKLLLGTIVATTVHPSGCVIFELSLTNRLSYRLIDNDIMALNLTITTISGRELLRIVDGHVRHGAEEPVRYERRTGRIRVTAPATPDFMPVELLGKLRDRDQTFASDGRLTILDLEVLEPGLVRVQGIWIEGQHAIAVTPEYLITASKMGGEYILVGMVGAGVDSVLMYSGPITSALFQFKL